MEINFLRKRKFKKEVWDYYKHHRRDLPWRRTRDPYKIFVSEIMLQQTQVARVIPKYRSFIKKFPDATSLSRASSRELLLEWRGLGYNRRALALKRASGMIADRFGGKLPRSVEELLLLPGVGRATAGAISAYAFQTPAPFIETNIRRTFLHFFFPRSHDVRDEAIMKLIETMVDAKNPREWYYAVVDFGAHLGASGENPNRRSAHYKVQPPFRGSLREARGKVLRLLTEKRMIKASRIGMTLRMPEARAEEAVASLVREGFLEQKGGKIKLVE